MSVRKLKSTIAIRPNNPSNFIIERNIPVSPKQRAGGIRTNSSDQPSESRPKLPTGRPPGRPRTSPCWAMKVGDSVFISHDLTASKNAKNMPLHVQLTTTAKFTTRTLVENEVSGTRIWRVS